MRRSLPEKRVRGWDGELGGDGAVHLVSRWEPNER